MSTAKGPFARHARWRVDPEGAHRDSLEAMRRGDHITAVADPEFAKVINAAAA